MAMCDTAAGYRVFKVPNLNQPECGGVPTGCLLEPPPNACPRKTYVRCEEGTVKKYILNMKNPGCDRVPVCRRHDQVYNNFDEQLGRMGDESVGRPSWSMGNGNTYRSGGHTMNSRGYLANPSRSSQIKARNAGALTNSEARSMGLNNYRGGRITNDEMEETVGQNCIFCTQNNK